MVMENKLQMFKPKFTITTEINKALVEIERVRGFLDAVTLKDDWISDMQKRALILESHHSTHIEGTALSLEQAKNLCGSIRRTATRDLTSLVQKGLIEMKGQLKSAYYVLSPAVKI